jgi:Holliday junction resolvase RusA-like endonuclease
MPRYWIETKVVSKGRPRLGRRRKAFTPPKTVEFEARVAELYARASHSRNHGNGPLGVEIEIHKDGFWVDIFPLECSVRPVGITGDVDNYVKSILDGLNTVAWGDDKQIELFTVSFVGIPRKGTFHNETLLEVPEVQPQNVDLEWTPTSLLTQEYPTGSPSGFRDEESGG